MKTITVDNTIPLPKPGHFRPTPPLPIDIYEWDKSWYPNEPTGNGVMRLHSRQAQKKFRVDLEAHTLSNVNLISIGEARGHGIIVDQGTLDSMMETEELKSGRLRAYITHGDLCVFDRLTDEAGLFTNPRIEGEHLRADFKPFDSFMKHQTAKFETLFELAEKTPDQFGVSIAFRGRAVWPTEGGNEVENDEKPDDALNELPSIRVDELFSADFVDNPAATRSLFRSIELKQNQSMPELPEDFNLAAHDVTLRRSVLETERERIESIIALADPHFKRSSVYKLGCFIRERLTGGASVEEFTADLLNHLAEAAPPLQRPAPGTQSDGAPTTPKTADEFQAALELIKDPSTRDEFVAKHSHLLRSI